MVNIFDAGKEVVKPTWAKFKNDGDAVQGTYIGLIREQKDGFGGTQNVYQLLQDDGSIVNVGFNLNKKILHQDMEKVNFGQIIGFKFKGKVNVKSRLTGQMIDVNDFALFQDPKIVNAEWLKENEMNMPTAVQGSDEPVESSDSVVEAPADVPFSSPGSLTNADKLAVIEKLAKDKLGVTDASQVKEKVMTATGIAFIPLNYDKITETLSMM